VEVRALARVSGLSSSVPIAGAEDVPACDAADASAGLTSAGDRAPEKIMRSV
jgi:hypothetical protein